MGKLGLGVHVISSGEKYRQVVENTKDENGKIHSETTHQERHNGSWRLRAPKVVK